MTIRHGLSLLIFSNLLGAGALATEIAPWLRMGGEINFDVMASSVDQFERKLRVQDAEVNFEILLREGVKIFIATDLSEALNKDSGESIDIAELLEEAYIEIETDKVSGWPRAIITLGKHYMAFGQKFSEIPMYKDSLFYKLTRQGEVIGMTVELPTDFFKMVDSAALSVFETGTGDLKIADEKGTSLRLKKKFSQNLSATISTLIKQNPDRRRTEKRGSVGFIFQNNDGTRKIWMEGVVTEFKPEYKDHTMALQVGGSQKWGPGAIVIEFEYIRDQAHELAVAYNLPVGSWLVISPEVRRRSAMGENFEDETFIGVRARLEAELELRHRLLSGRKRN